MNVAETIQAAIEKLQHLRDNSTPGPWLEEDHEEEFVGFIVGAGYKLATEITIIEDGQSRNDRSRTSCAFARSCDSRGGVLMRHDYGPDDPGGGFAAVIAVGITFGVIVLAVIGVVGFFLTRWH